MVRTHELPELTCILLEEDLSGCHERQNKNLDAHKPQRMMASIADVAKSAAAWMKWLNALNKICSDI